MEIRHAINQTIEDRATGGKGFSILTGLLLLCAPVVVILAFEQAGEHFLENEIYLWGGAILATFGLALVNLKGLAQYTKGGPLLGTAVLLFLPGIVFTCVELAVRLGNPKCELPSGGCWQSQWEDTLLALSAVCVLIEEFRLLRVYRTRFLGHKFGLRGLA